MESCSIDWNSEVSAIRGWYASHAKALWSLAGFFGVFLIWELGAATGVTNREFMSSPSEVLAAGIKEVQLSRFWVDLGTSLVEFLTGFILAVLLGVPLGLAMAWYRRLSYFVEPLINFLYATPRIALLPLVILWFGIGIWSKVAIVFLGAFITILLQTFRGVRTMDDRYVTVANAFNAGDRLMFTAVALPSALPFILTGLRLGTGRALIGVVVSELYASNAGIGYMINIASNNFQIDRLLFGISILVVFGVVTVESIRALERRFAPWHVASVGSS